MTWKHVVAILILTGGFFATAWKAPLVLVLLFLLGAWLVTRGEGE